MSERTLFDVFETDKKLEDDGKWIEYPLGLDDGKNPEFKCGLVSDQNKKFAKAVKKIFAPYRQLQENGSLSEEQTYALNRLAFCEGFLYDWKNVRGKDGKLIKFSVDNANDFFKAIPHFYSWLEKRASVLATFKAEQRESDAKNS